MLQGMEGPSLGSVLEVRLTSDIRQESVMAFLQYLYEGFMMLTEENVIELEKIARLLQVDSVTKCCMDFHKVLREAAGIAFATMPKCSFHADQAEFRHVRASDLIHSTDNAGARRVIDTEPPHKRVRTEPNEPIFVFNNYAQRNHVGRQNFTPSKQVIEDSFEMVQTEKDPLKAKIHQNIGVKVTSHVDSMSDIHIINLADTETDPNSYSSPNQSPFTVVNPNKHLAAISLLSHRKHSPKTVGQSLSSVVRNLSARPRAEVASVFTPITSGQNKSGENQSESKSEHPDQIVIQPITVTDGDESPVNTSSKGDDSNDRTGIGTSNR